MTSISTMHKRLALIGALVLALGVFAFAAKPAEASCTQAKAYFWTGANGTGDFLTVCYPSNAPTVPGWNDTFSSVQFYDITVNTAICLWTDANFQGSGLRFLYDQAVPYNLSSPWNNSGSSIEWGNNCLAAGISSTP